MDFHLKGRRTKSAATPKDLTFVNHKKRFEWEAFEMKIFY